MQSCDNRLLMAGIIELMIAVVTRCTEMITSDRCQFNSNAQDKARVLGLTFKSRLTKAMCNDKYTNKLLILLSNVTARYVLVQIAQ